MLARIIRHDLRLLASDRTLALIAALFAALLAYGIWNGASLVHARAQGMADAERAAAARIDQQRQQLVDVREGRKDAADIFGLGKAYGVEVVAALPLAPLAPLSLGASEVLPSSTSVTIFSTKDDPVKQSDLDNPANLRAGRFDVAFFFVYLYPLLALALSYNLLSQEKEQGTLALTMAHPVSLAKLIAGKTIARCGILMGLALVGVALGLIAVGAPLHQPGTLARFLLWFAALAGYTAFWLALAIFVNLLGKSSATNASLLAAVWLLLVVIYPALLNLGAASLHPLPSRLQFINDQRAAETETNREAAQLLNRYLNDHPELAPGDPEKNVRDFQLRYFVQKQELERRSFDQTRAYERQLARQQAAIDRFGFLSPAIALQETMNDLAGASRRRHELFIEQVRQLIDDVRAKYAPVVVALGSLAEEDYARVPRFVWQEESLGENRGRILGRIGLLFAPVALFALLVVWRLRRYSLVSLVLACALTVGASDVFAQTPSPSPSPPPANYDLRWGVKVPMRDTVELNATLYLPKSAEGAPQKTPVIFTLTPYIADSYHERGAYFAAHGYAFALVDVRGRGNSGGEFEPFANDARDGHDIVEWLARQPFCDGKVTMWGGSYAGFNQWATAKEFPPHLATIVPVASPHPPLDFPWLNNIGESYAVLWLTLTSGKAKQDNLFGDSKFWRAKYLDAFQKHLPFNALDSHVGNPSVHFQRWLKHPTCDAYWDAMRPSAEQYKKIALPILTITGQYDGDARGAHTFYRDHLAQASPEARGKHFLIIGPWNHAGTRTPKDEVEGVKLGPGALLDLNNLHRQWYDWTMKGGARPEFLKDAVAYYVIAAGNSGANGEWKYAPSLEALTANPKSFFLDSKDGDANGVFRSGIMSETAPKGGTNKFTYDPLDLRRAQFVEGRQPNEKTSNLDQTHALSIGEDGLVYHTAPLPAETPLIGCPALTLWLSLDTPDTDLAADLYEIQPDGTSIALWSDYRRLRYRESLRQEKLVRPGEVVKCEFNPGIFLARRLMKGSRLRLVIFAPNSIEWQKNYNSGGVLANETATDARTAHIEILHDQEHASAMQLPLR